MFSYLIILRSCIELSLYCDRLLLVGYIIISDQNNIQDEYLARAHLGYTWRTLPPKITTVMTVAFDMYEQDTAKHRSDFTLPFYHNAAARRAGSANDISGPLQSCFGVNERDGAKAKQRHS